MVNKITILFTAVVMLVSCAKSPEAALLPLPKLVEYTGGSVKADTPVTETLVDAIPEARRRGCGTGGRRSGSLRRKGGFPAAASWTGRVSGCGGG